MYQTILVALIGTTGVIVGAILTFLASAFATQQKIKELDIVYQQKLDESYLANARLHIDTIYLPINISLTKLAAEYQKFQNNYQITYQPQLFYADDSSEEKEKQKLKEKNEKVEEDFRHACREFLDEISELTSQGKDAYLTVRLSERLQAFTDFLEQSIFADVPVVEPQPIRWFNIPDYIHYRNWHKMNRPSYPKARSYTTIYLLEPSPHKGLNIHNTFNYFLEVELPHNKTIKGKVIRACIVSTLFQNLILSDIRTLKSLVQEVTLGATISNKTH